MSEHPEEKQKNNKRKYQDDHASNSSTSSTTTSSRPPEIHQRQVTYHQEIQDLQASFTASTLASQSASSASALHSFLQIISLSQEYHIIPNQNYNSGDFRQPPTTDTTPLDTDTITMDFNSEGYLNKEN